MSQKIHFKGLDGLRFYAALSVVVQHIMYSPNDWYGDPSLPDTVGRFFISGNDHVNLFFVLSGFLIIYLLLKEREQHGKISVRKFYIRRILRIWPLYYLIIALAGIVLPLLLTGFTSPLSRQGLALLLLCFLGNFAFPMYIPYPPLEHLWSIAVEEQFYLIVPHLVRLKVHLAKLLVGFLVIYWLIWFITQRTLPAALFSFLLVIRYDCIAIGGLFACILYYRSPLLKWIYHPLAGYGALLAVAMMAAFIHEGWDALVYTVATCFIFGILILNVSTNPKFRLKLDHPWLEYGGKFSYGIYMYHPLILLTFRWLFYGKLETALYQFLIYPVVIGLTLLVSALSYLYFERRFLNLKDRFSPLMSAVPSSPVVLERSPDNL
ncbi:MAG: acyltransferase [Anaerolineae bacterium]